jgi:hypothetical protein
MQEMNDVPDPESKETPNVSAQRLTHLIEDWESTAEETKKRAKKEPVEQKRVTEELCKEDNSSIIAARERLIAEVKQKSDKIVDQVMNKMRKQLEKSS